MIYQRKNETGQQYRERVLDPLSETFCGAKWYNASVWLNNGMTTSCHHPPAHKIPLEEIQVSPKALHNTKYKKSVRQQMIDGTRPPECDYCWRVEDMGPSNVSDRIFKSNIYSDDDLAKCIDEYGSSVDVDLKTLEIAFDSVCNFACSYCNPSFSSTWQGDIKKNGIYENLVSDGGAAYTQDGSWTIPYGLKNENNPYMEAFWEWWEGDLQHSLEELRITGGEATMSPDFWKLMDWWKANPQCEVRLAVNSNLGANPNLIKRLSDVSHSFKAFDLYTSNEAFGAHAEYVRDGMVWETWLSNLRLMMSQGNFRSVSVMLTNSILCLFSLDKFMDEMLALKKEFRTQSPVMSFNILRFPSFMSIVTLPKTIRNKQADILEEWLQRNKDHEYFSSFEQDGLNRLIAYTRTIEEGHSNTSSIQSRERDFKTFHMQYDKRRGKSFKESFADCFDLLEWYDSIPQTNLKDGESIINFHREGWVEKPKQSNPGSQEFEDAV